MNKLRQSLRRKKPCYVPEASRPHQWQFDEEAVRKGKCSFPVRYLGHVEVDESRGMHVCEEAVKKLKTIGKKSVKAVLWVSADGLRVVDDKTKDLILDQTIEKVSFCAPDRNYDKAFSYICRDGTTRRWICHCFMALKDSGERLSHAVGCAFAACLERKQKREKECGVTASFDASRTSFVREGSFRVTSTTQQAEREEVMKQLQDRKKAESPSLPADSASPPEGAASPVDRTETGYQHAIPRRHAPIEQLVRQGSFRGFPALSQKNSPFKRQLSLRLNELPSTLQRKTDFQCLKWSLALPTKRTASTLFTAKSTAPSASPPRSPSPPRQPPTAPRCPSSPPRRPLPVFLQVQQDGQETLPASPLPPARWGTSGRRRRLSAGWRRWHRLSKFSSSNSHSNSCPPPSWQLCRAHQCLSQMPCSLSLWPPPRRPWACLFHPLYSLHTCPYPPTCLRLPTACPSQASPWLASHPPRWWPTSSARLHKRRAQGWQQARWLALVGIPKASMRPPQSL
ncbi:protein numb homolog isoform X3 [Polyodon spathula]|uniref:protein numb homolog isoform X3 n=1 Tax=Polyodon spathula TaxID=7913 RepID=UPI001B7DAFA2|nr:protein numb homolog isoform X3 [Polyodon spathula]